MKQNQQWSILIIDIAGCSVVVTCMLGMLWFTTIRASQHSQEWTRLNHIRQTTHNQLAQTNNQCQQERMKALAIEQDMIHTGKLPTTPPVENYFQTLSMLAKQHHLRVLRHNPLTGRNYHGLNEQRFLYEITGTLPDLTKFFKAIESTDYWADISYLKIDQGHGMYRSMSKQRVAQLTISMFSSANTQRHKTDS